ncbi:hypothetical protein AOA13_208c [Listeria monocytogenes]|nr:hypothetical protein AOB47_438c [Listeria monocytogenes]KSZ48547.1 hypothetical protein AOA13_208c [Listeria monocytogenes]CUL51018.1 hypothetical protein LM77097_40212 [Listeria monocytogenes]CUM24305.1 hypothetical protein LM900942_50162 [Listeria monocytogenes]CUM30868.1 hypothetical protein LM901004_50162 [Listeria monocytogenes]
MLAEFPVDVLDVSLPGIFAEGGVVFPPLFVVGGVFPPVVGGATGFFVN